MIFVNSMSDLFQDGVPDEYIIAVAKVMQLANWHTFQVLTKRSDRMRDMLQDRLSFMRGEPHVWWGVSVENRRHGLPRIKHLQATPAPVRFLSIEPLLEDLGEVGLTGIDWVIVGGESGAGARPIREEWIRRIQRQCEVQDVHFFFKQWGGVRKHENGRELDGETFDAIPQRLQRSPADRELILNAFNEIAMTVNFADDRRVTL
jgi:protein gp37